MNCPNSRELVPAAGAAVAAVFLLLPRFAIAQQYATTVQVATSPAANWPTATVAAGAPIKFVGGGARTNWTGNGNLLTSSGPGAPGRNAWIGAGKDHISPDPATLTVYGIGLADPADDWEVAIFSQTSAPASHPTATATLPADYALTGGGCFVDWHTSLASPGNLLTASFPSSLSSWECDSKDHAVAGPAAITAYVVGIRAKKRGMPPPIVRITTATSAVGNHPEAVAPGVPGFVVTGGGARALAADPAGWGQLLTATVPTTSGTPTPTGWFAASKDHVVASPGTVQAYAVNLAFAASATALQVRTISWTTGSESRIDRGQVGPNGDIVYHGPQGVADSGGAGSDQLFATGVLQNGWVVTNASLRFFVDSPAGVAGDGAATLGAVHIGTNMPAMAVSWSRGPQTTLRYNFSLEISGPRDLPDGIACRSAPCP